MAVAQLVVALGVGLLIGAGLTLAFVGSPPADAGDWLTFTGALVGVVATMLGTLWLERHRSLVQERKQRKTVISSLNEIVAALRVAREPRGNVVIETARPARIAAEQALLKALDKFTYARHHIPQDDIDCWQAMETLNDAINREKPILEREARIISDAGENEAVFGVNINIMIEIAERLEPLLNAALAEIRD